MLVKLNVTTFKSSAPVTLSRSLVPAAVLVRSKSMFALVSVVAPTVSVPALPKLFPLVMLPGATRLPAVTVSIPVAVPGPPSVAAVLPPLSTMSDVPVADPLVFDIKSLPAVMVVVPP